MKFTRYNNPSRRRKSRRPTHSAAYIAERRAELEAALARSTTPENRELLLKAYDVTVRP